MLVDYEHFKVYVIIIKDLLKDSTRLTQIGKGYVWGEE
jgi:hypothetical protein